MRRPAPPGTVDPASAPLDTWDALPGDTRWVDYSHHVADDGYLTVYAHSWRRYRDRGRADVDLLGWKPGTTTIATEYAPEEWTEVEAIRREWPPAGFEEVEKQVRDVRAERIERAERRRERRR